MADVKEVFEKNQELARKVWYAGLGVYGKGFDNLQNGYEKMNEESRSFFEKLVSRGEEFQDETKELLTEASEKIKERGEKIKAKGEKITDIKFDDISEDITGRFDKIRSKVKDKVAMPGFVKSDDLEDLNKKIDSLTRAVNKMSKTTAPKRAAAAKSTDS